MGTKSSVTNEDILDVVNDLATMVGQGFEGMNQQFARINNTLAEHSTTLRDHSTQLTQLRLTTERILGVQEAHAADISAIYEILEKLEAKLEISESERKDAAIRLQRLIAWAHKVAKHLDIPLNDEPGKRTSTIA